MSNTEETNMNNNEIITELDSMMHRLDTAIEQGMKELNNAQDMCECCNDAVQAHRARGYKVCLDCFYELGV